MALYEDGKVKFTDEWINQFSDDALKAFLIVKRYNLTLSKKSKYCTVENLLYNNRIDELIDSAYNFMLGHKRTTPKNYETNSVRVMIFTDMLEQILKGIYQNMIEENNW